MCISVIRSNTSPTWQETRAYIETKRKTEETQKTLLQPQNPVTTLNIKVKSTHNNPIDHPTFQHGGATHAGGVPPRNSYTFATKNSFSPRSGREAGVYSSNYFNKIRNNLYHRSNNILFQQRPWQRNKADKTPRTNLTVPCHSKHTNERKLPQHHSTSLETTIHHTSRVRSPRRSSRNHQQIRYTLSLSPKGKRHLILVLSFDHYPCYSPSDKGGGLMSNTPVW